MVERAERKAYSGLVPMSPKTTPSEPIDSSQKAPRFLTLSVVGGLGFGPAGVLHDRLVGGLKSQFKSSRRRGCVGSRRGSGAARYTG